MSAMAATLRPAREDDAPFLFRVYASTRSQELARLNWSEAEKDAFLRMQFAAQTQHYREHYAGARFDVIECGGEPAGRLSVLRAAGEIRLVELALLPPHRGRGVGTRLLRELLAEAAAAGLPVRVHVERTNPALLLYSRLGFTPIAERGPYLQLEWSAAAQPAAPHAAQEA
jgi:ribosomal protein S18 acetylase RimI-like enzyme